MLCHFAHQFPAFVEDFLERGRRLRRRFREETVTDLLMGSLITAGGRRVIVEFPDEPVTGADMEWNFVNPDDGTFFRVLIQAKQSYGRGKFWTRHAYAELLHQAGTGTKLQAVALCDTARAESATYPLYAFYHPHSTSAAARDAGFADVAGVNLADGYLIERLATGATTQKLRTRNKSLGMIALSLFPLEALFCPSTILETGPFALAPGRFAFPMSIGRVGRRTVAGIPIPPTPQEIRQRIVASRETLAETEDLATTDRTDVPEVSSIPDEVKAAIEQARADRPSGRGLRRWRATFVSSSPRDIEAELALLPQTRG